ncbi:MAG: hypothetical protein CM1200mP41_06790 [Gammaproteobacteria bacterium]|nr:MAG: hypothetical protein CM1200mP41_06790 [Gammaproteobacteria bacterium]
MGWFKRDLIRCLGVFCLGLGLAVSASDVEKEGRWAEEVVDQLFDGEPVWLLTDSVRFLGLHVVPESGHGGGLLILHGRGVHPDWPQVVNPLRVALAEAGWHTLSLQLPVLANGVPGPDYKALFPKYDLASKRASSFSNGRPQVLGLSSLTVWVQRWRFMR